VADEWHPTVFVDETDELIAQRGLADAGLADQHDQVALPTGRFFESCFQLLQFGLPTDERHVGLGQRRCNVRPVTGTLRTRCWRVCCHAPPL
jgi:hypothetical protein